MTGATEPDYQRLARLIRDRITSGDYPLDTAIPSTTKLVEETRMSQPVVRRAIEHLQAEGILAGRQGKGVFVIATPADAERERVNLKALSEQVTGLQREVRKLTERADAAQPADFASDLTEIRDTVGRIEANLIDLYGKTGHDYPQDGTHDAETATARHGRTRR